MRLAINRHTPTWQIGATVLAYLVSAAIGFRLGFDFVQNAQGGAVLGVVVGLNAALFCTLLADWLLSRLVRQPPRTGR
jgi:hypothetical protein